MHTTDCLFCKIVAGEIPSLKVYENADTFAFLDIKPVNPGHTLVIPKAHYANSLETPEDVLMKMTATVKKLAHAITESLGTSDFNLAMNNGADAGQVIFHTHMHVIPRHKGDGHGLWHGVPYEAGEAEAIAEKIKDSLS